MNSSAPGDAPEAPVETGTAAPIAREARASPAAARLRLDADLKKLWTALSISLVGSEVTKLALPLIAALTLNASPVQMGILGALGWLPFLVCTLPAGLFVDRVPRKPVLVASDLASALLLLTLPLAVPLGGPSFAHLCVVAFGVGALTVANEVAHYAYVPTLVGRQHITEFNSRLQISHSASTAAGPGLGGALVQAVSGPGAVLVDAVSFLASALLIRSIRQPEPPLQNPERQPSLRESLADGLRMLFRHPLLRPIMVAGSAMVFFEAASLAIVVLYATRELGLHAALLGLVFAAGGVGAIPGALLARWAGARFGIGPSIIGGWLAAAAAGVLVPLAAGPIVLVVALLAISKCLGSLTETVANIHQWSLRQIVTPDRLAGRVTASMRFVVYGAGSLGALAGGISGSALGLRETLFATAGGSLLSPLLAVFSPLRSQREQPPGPEPEEVEADSSAAASFVAESS